MSNPIVPFTLSADLANNGTTTIGYPQGRSRGNFLFTDSLHFLSLGGNVYSSPKDFTLTFNASNITLTNKTGRTLQAGLSGRVEFSQPGDSRTLNILPQTTRVIRLVEVACDLGSPIAAADNSVAVAQAVAAAGNLTLTTAGRVPLDVPRNLQFVSSGSGDTTQTITVYGVDEYGATMVESVTANGVTVVQGKKAFAAVTRVAVSAALAGNVKVGHGTVLGVPVAMRAGALIQRELVDAAVPGTAGTFVAGLSGSLSTATSADVRGTYTPNSAPDGSRGYMLILGVNDAADVGVAQFAG